MKLFAFTVTLAVCKMDSTRAFYTRESSRGPPGAGAARAGKIISAAHFRDRKWSRKWKIIGFLEREIMIQHAVGSLLRGHAELLDTDTRENSETVQIPTHGRSWSY